MNKKRTLAKMTGYSLLLMAIIAGFAFGFAFPKVFDPTLRCCPLPEIDDKSIRFCK